MEINEETLALYRSALYTSIDHKESNALKEFKASFPNEYKHINTCYQKRVKIRDCIEAIESLGFTTYWFTLTFKVEKQSNTEEWKRKEAFQFLNERFEFFMIVEEYGEENGLFHFHGFGNLKPGKTWECIKEWHSRQNIKAIENERFKKQKIRYLTNYATKTAPRVRKNKRMVKLVNSYKKAKKLKNCFPSLFEERMKCAYIDSMSCEMELPF